MEEDLRFAEDLRQLAMEAFDGGARDSGILALVARTCSDRRADVVVLDVCGTPVELCRQYAQRWSLPVETLRSDLALFERERDFDLVIIDGTLSYIPKDKLAKALSQVARGKLILSAPRG
jgi:hypothetical protein